MVLPLYVAVERLDPVLVEAAWDLYASRWAVFSSGGAADDARASSGAASWCSFRPSVRLSRRTFWAGRAA